MFKYKKPTTKKDIYNHQLEKLNVLISFYNEEDFDSIKYHNLNVDQLLVFLGNENFVLGRARKEKVVESLHFL
jgi:hypothetical protein